jgi:hypothetical protein
MFQNHLFRLVDSYQTFNAFASPTLFSHVPHWLDYKISHQAVLSLVHDAFNRPAVVWSLWALEPTGPVDDVWMGIVWKLLMKADPPGFSLFKEVTARHLTAGHN